MRGLSSGSEQPSSHCLLARSEQPHSGHWPAKSEQQCSHYTVQSEFYGWGRLIRLAFILIKMLHWRVKCTDVLLVSFILWFSNRPDLTQPARPTLPRKIFLGLFSPNQSRDSYRVTLKRDATTVKGTWLQLKGTWLQQKGNLSNQVPFSCSRVPFTVVASLLL